MGGVGVGVGAEGKGSMGGPSGSAHAAALALRLQRGTRVIVEETDAAAAPARAPWCDAGPAGCAHCLPVVDSVQIVGWPQTSSPAGCAPWGGRSARPSSSCWFIASCYCIVVLLHRAIASSCYCIVLFHCAIVALVYCILLVLVKQAACFGAWARSTENEVGAGGERQQRAAASARPAAPRDGGWGDGGWGGTTSRSVPFFARACRRRIAARGVREGSDAAHGAPPTSPASCQ